MSNRLYIGDSHRDNGIWDWTLGNRSDVSEITSVAKAACETGNFTVYVDAGGVDTARSLYQVFLDEHEWILDIAYWGGMKSMSPPDADVESLLKWVEEAEKKRGSG